MTPGEGGLRTELGPEDRVIYAFRRNVVVAASAGTGKTHRLTGLYVLLALGLTSMGRRDEAEAASAVPPERIVATTFSRAAALEMGTRVEQALRALTRYGLGERTPYDGVIAARLATLGMALPAAEIRSRAEGALASMPSARIDTLHGLAARIVQTHALALGLLPGSRVLDEDEAQALADVAVDEALDAALRAGGDEAAAARDLVSACGGVGPLRVQVVRLLSRLDEEGVGPLELGLADHAAHARAAAIEVRRVLGACAGEGGPAVRERARRALDALATPGGPGGEDGGGERAVPGRAALPLLEVLSARASSGKRTRADDELDALLPTLLGSKAGTKASRAASLVAYLCEGHEVGARDRRVRALLEDARRRLVGARRRARAVAFGDILRAARDGLRDLPEVARAVRGTLDVLLVDEFQDTSRVQRDLVYLLRERDGAREAGRSAPEHLIGHGLFIVGDRKQSIYGFRGADVAVFCAVCGELAGRPAAEALALPAGAWPAAPIADFVALRESRRSGPRMLAFVNALSSRDFARGARDGVEGLPLRSFEVAYGPAEHLAAADGPSASAPRDEVVVVRDAPRAGAPAEAETSGTEVGTSGAGLSPRDGPVAAPDASRPTAGALGTADGPARVAAEPVWASGPAREAQVAAAIVAREVRGGGSGTRFRDVAVLARRRGTIPFVEIALSRLGVPYVVAGRALYDAAEVRDVAALLRLLLDPADRLALAIVLRGPVVALSDTALAALSVPQKGLVVPLLRGWPRAEDVGLDGAPAVERLHPHDRERLEAFRATFKAARPALLRSAPGEAVRLAMRAFDLDRALAALPRAAARIGNVDRLVAIARRRGGTLAGFLRWLEHRMQKEADEPEAAVFSPEDDAVRVTTIHASKGLDFPIVVLLDLNATPTPDARSIGFATMEDVEPAGERGLRGDGAARTLFVRHAGHRPSLEAVEAACPEARAYGEPIVLPTAVLRAARAEARMREAAERRRLTYVAVTRARRALFLVGPGREPRAGSAWSTIAAGLSDEAFAAAVTRIEDAADIVARAHGLEHRVPDASAAEQPAPRPERPREAAFRTIATAATPLSLFRGCARRYRLRVLAGLDEPVSSGQLDLFADGWPDDVFEDGARAPSGPHDDDEGDGREGELGAELRRGADDPRALGRAVHRVLERWPRAKWGCAVDRAEVASRIASEGVAAAGSNAAQMAEGVARFLEGPYARTIADRESRVEREEPFVLEVDLPSPRHPHEEAEGTEERRVLAVRGAMDLVVDHPGGEVDVVDYKRSRPRSDLGPYAFQLRTYALAVRRRYPGRPVRAGVVFLGSSVEPQWLGGTANPIPDAGHEAFERELRELGLRYAEARWSDRHDGVALSQCRKLRCGFIPACHGQHGKRP